MDHTASHDARARDADARLVAEVAVEQGDAVAAAGSHAITCSLRAGALPPSAGRNVVVRLQRLAGNEAVTGAIRAVQRQHIAQREDTVQRQGATAPPLSQAVQVTSGAGTPSIAGKVTATSTSVTSVRITAPDTTFPDTEVGLTAHTTLGNGKSIQVGIMQTLMGSKRIARYRSPGTPTGDAPIEKRQEMGQARDASASMDPSTGAVFARASAPFYLPPATLSDAHAGDTIHVAEAGTAGLLDRPGWSASLVLGSGTFAPELIGTGGSDDFLTSIAAKYNDDAALFHMHSSSWSVPWDMQIDALGSGTGGAGKVAASTTNPPETAGDIAAIQAMHGAGKAWIEFPTFGDAMMCSVGTLLANLKPSQANDPKSFGFTVDALVAKNPTVQATVTVNTKMRGVGQEKLSLTIGGFVSAPPQSWELDEGDSVVARVQLSQVLEKGSITGGAALTFVISVVPVFGGPKVGQASMPSPYLPVTPTVSIDGGAYTVAARLLG